MKCRKPMETFSVIVYGRTEADDRVVRVKARSAEEAEMNTADKFRERDVKVVAPKTKPR